MNDRDKAINEYYAAVQNAKAYREALERVEWLGKHKHYSGWSLMIKSYSSGSEVYIPHSVLPFVCGTLEAALKKELEQLEAEVDNKFQEIKKVD